MINSVGLNSQPDQMTELLMYGDRECHANYAKVIEVTLSTYLQRKISVIVEDEFNLVVNRWVYRVYMDVDSQLRPVIASPSDCVFLRRLVTNAYAGTEQVRDYLLNPWDGSDLVNGGFSMIERETVNQGGMVGHTFWPGVLPNYSHRAITYYWIIRGWVEACKLRDNTVSPPRLNNDNTITVFIRDQRDLHEFILLIKRSVFDNINTPIQIEDYDRGDIWDQRTLTFRAMTGRPLIIGQYGIRDISEGDNRSEGASRNISDANRISEGASRNIKQQYLDWLYPCIDNDDLSWSEFGRIIKHNDQCHALGETPDTDEQITFMRIARPLALAGVYPLGPFPGLLDWPYIPPNINDDRKILGLPSISQLLLKY